jgi:NADH:ubiquinone oxidoreductase subunit 4 (subunit M)
VSALVSLLIWAPLVGALIVPFFPERTADQRGRVRIVGLFASGAALFFSLLVAFMYIGDPTATTIGTLNEQHNWIVNVAFAVTYHVDIDGTAVALIQLTALLFCCAAFYSWKYNEHIRLRVASMLVLETSLLGVLCSQDLFLLTLFWAGAGAPLYLLIRHTVNGERTATRFAVYFGASWGLLLLAVSLLAFHTPASGYSHTFDMGVVLAQNILATVPGVGREAFALLMLALAIGCGAVPFHRGFVAVAGSEDAGVASLYAGVLSKVGLFVVMKVGLQAFPEMIISTGWLFMLAGAVTGFWGLACSWRAGDLRQAVAYFGVFQTGLALLAFGSATVTSLVGLVLMLVAQGLVQAILTYVAAGVVERTKTAQISKLGGLAWQAPRLAGFWVLAALVAVGTPLLPVFTAMLLMTTGAYVNHHVAGFLIVILVMLSGFVLLGLGRRVFFGPSQEAYERSADIGTLDFAVLVPIVAGVVMYGVLPLRIIPVIEFTARAIATRVGAQ